MLPKLAISSIVKQGGRLARIFLERHGAKIGFIAGTGLIIYGTAKTVKKAPEGAKILKDHDEKLKDINRNLADGKITEKEAKKEKGSLYLGTTGKLAMTYGPSVGAVVGGITINGFTLMKICKIASDWKQKANLAEEVLFAYRKNVRRDLGPEADLKYLTGKQEETVKITTMEPGKEPVVEEAKVERTNFNKSLYLYVWRPLMYDPELGRTVGSAACDPSDFETNVKKLKLALQAARAQLDTDGYIYMNEILDNLSMKQDRVGHHAGWTKEGCKARGEMLDFLMEGAIIEEAREHWYKYREMRFLLDFNVEGNIDDKVEWGRKRSTRSW